MGLKMTKVIKVKFLDELKSFLKGSSKLSADKNKLIDYSESRENDDEGFFQRAIVIFLLFIGSSFLLSSIVLFLSAFGLRQIEDTTFVLLAAVYIPLALFFRIQSKQLYANVFLFLFTLTTISLIFMEAAGWALWPVIAGIVLCVSRSRLMNGAINVLALPWTLYFLYEVSSKDDHQLLYYFVAVAMVVLVIRLVLEKQVPQLIRYFVLEPLGGVWTSAGVSALLVLTSFDFFKIETSAIVINNIVFIAVIAGSLAAGTHFKEFLWMRNIGLFGLAGFIILKYYEVFWGLLSTSIFLAGFGLILILNGLALKHLADKYEQK